MRKIFLAFALIACFALTGAGCSNGSVGGGGSDNVAGGTDADGFVRFPGEPSRNDPSHYYVLEDICGQFTKTFMEFASGKKILRMDGPPADGLYYCQYNVDTAENGAKIDKFFSLSMDYLSVENQKKGHEFLGRTIKTDPRIKMEHFIVMQEDGLINEIYFVLGPNKFISLNRSSGEALTEEEAINLAIKLGEKMQNFR